MSPEAWVPMGQPWQDCQQVQERPGAGEPLAATRAGPAEKSSSEDTTDDSSEGKAPSANQTRSLS